MGGYPLDEAFQYRHLLMDEYLAYKPRIGLGFPNALESNRKVRANEATAPPKERRKNGRVTIIKCRRIL